MRREDAVPEAFLEITDERGITERVALNAADVTLGRSQEADIQLEGPAISRRHARLWRQGPGPGHWFLQDLGSQNGTLLNGRAIAQAQVHAGETIQIGSYGLCLVLAGADDHRQPLPPPSSAAAPWPVTEEVGAISVLRQIEPPHVSTRHLARLSTFGEELIGLDDDAGRLDALCRLVVGEAFRGRAALALRLTQEGDCDRPQVISAAQWGRGEFETPHLSRTLLRAVWENREPVMATNMRHRVTSGDSSGVVGAGARSAVELSIGAEVRAMSAMACPLVCDETGIRALYMTLPPEFATGEWLALVALAVRQYQQAELAWAGRRQGEALAAIERELAQARKLQMRFVPPPRSMPRLETGIGFEPCRWVGGDYVDILPLADGRVLLTVADVCGKGMQAALTTASVHTMVHTGIRSGVAFEKWMALLNEHLLETLPDTSFVTMLAMLLDPATGQIQSINAGHPPALVLSPEGEVHLMHLGANPPLGVMADPLEVVQERLEEGHWLALYSDGLSELTDERGAMLEIAGLGRELATLRHQAGPGATAGQMAERLMARVRQIQGEQQAADDYTLLVARRLPG